MDPVVAADTGRRRPAHRGPVTAGPSDWARLGEVVAQGRAEAGFPHPDGLAVAAGLSTPTIVNLEAGRPVRISTLRAVEGPLRWRRGTALRILGGGPTAPQTTVHLYTSTYCQHEQCGSCRLWCKVCYSPCLCPCHYEEVP